MQVIFKQNWFGPDGRVKASEEPQEVVDAHIGVLPSTSTVVGPPAAVKKRNALLKKAGHDPQPEADPDIGKNLEEDKPEE